MMASSFKESYESDCARSTIVSSAGGTTDAYYTIGDVIPQRGLMGDFNMVPAERLKDLEGDALLRIMITDLARETADHATFKLIMDTNA